MGVTFVEANVRDFRVGVSAPGHREGAGFLAAKEQSVLNHDAGGKIGSMGEFQGHANIAGSVNARIAGLEAIVHQDAFAPVISKKIEETEGELVGVYYAPDDKAFIVDRLRELLKAGADLLITTGGMSVDPDDVTRFAIRELGAGDITYGSAVLPGAMFLVAYLGEVPILGIPACGMYAKTTIFDLALPRILSGEKIGRKELAELGHGGLCMKCEVCRYPVCPFGK